VFTKIDKHLYKNKIKNSMYRIHIYGNPTVPSSLELTCDAFTMTAYKYAKALKEIGCYIIFYGTLEYKDDYSGVYDEYISISNLEMFKKISRTMDVISCFSRGEYLSNLLSEDDLKEKINLSDAIGLNFYRSLDKTVKKNDILLTFFDVSYGCLYKKFEELGGIVIEGLCQYSTQDWTLRFNRSVFSSTHEMNLRHKIQKSKGEHHIVIPPFFDENDFIYNPKIRNEKGPFLYLARLQACKGIDLFIELAKHYTDKIFWIAGQGKCKNKKLYYQGYNKEEKHVNLKEYPNIIYKGCVGKEKRAVLLSKASALIQPSIYDEPFGWNVIEANMSGTPVITSDRGGFLDTVKYGLNGYRTSLTVSWEKWDYLFEKVIKLSPSVCRYYALSKYTKQVVIPKYIDFIKNVSDMPGELYIL
jgi:glycosyltransferase involved in cell wall biosynthesis